MNGTFPVDPIKFATWTDMINCCRKDHRKKRKVGFADVVDRACKHRVVDPAPCLLQGTSSVIHVNPPEEMDTVQNGVGQQVNER
jgi:hypothetical protein